MEEQMAELCLEVTMVFQKDNMVEKAQQGRKRPGLD